MAKRVLIFDTSVLCCLLKIPGKETAGSVGDIWDHSRISQLVIKETSQKSTFVLPLASLIETGNHVAQAPGDRYSMAIELGKLISSAAMASTPWAAFTDQSGLWEEEQLANLAGKWPDLAKSGLSIGDATIKDVAEYYAKAGFSVEIITGDAGLKAYEPASRVQVPRRRQLKG